MGWGEGMFMKENTQKPGDGDEPVWYLDCGGGY